MPGRHLESPNETKRSRNAVRPAIAMAIAMIVAFAPERPRAACNLIPGTAKSFAGFTGAATRPFSAPGEAVEIELRACDPEPTAFQAPAGDFLVTALFTAAGGSQHAVVSTASSDCTAVAPHLAACTGALTGPAPTASCMSAADGSGVTIRERNGARLLGFRFPDTDDRLGAADDDRTLAGEVRLVVSRLSDLAADGLPCAVASIGCAAAGPGPVACIDELFVDDGACGTALLDPTFGHFAALPPPNDYQASCFTEDPPCTASVGAGELHAAVDRDGNLLVPLDWHGILVRDAGVPVPRLVRARFRSPLPFSVPDEAFLGSFSPEGGLLPPIFEAQLDPAATAPDTVTLFGSVDAPYTVIRFARRHGRCQAGSLAGEPCSNDAQCPQGVCGTTCVGKPAKECSTDADCGASGPCGALFDFGPLAPNGLLSVSRQGPGFCQDDLSACTTDADCPTTCVLYALEAESPVPLEGLAASDAARAFVARESIDAKDRNGDGDTIDSVVTLRDRASGLLQPIGSTCLSPAEGRAVVRVSDPPFSFPVVAVEDDVLALLESESSSGECDLNGDGDNLDALLGVVHLDGTETTPLPIRAVDAEPRIDGRPLALSAGRVFVRTSEPSMAVRAMETFPDGAGDVSMSPDARFIAFSTPVALLPEDGNGLVDVYLRDRVAGTLVRVSVPSGGGDADADSFRPAVSDDGSTVAFESTATNLGSGFPGVTSVYVRDVAASTTSLVSVGGFDAGECPSISSDGSVIAFQSDDPLLVPGDLNGVRDVFVRDRATGTNERVSVPPPGGEANGASSGQCPSISGDGRFVVFGSDATNLLTGTPGDTSAGQIFVHDRASGENEIVSVSGDGVAGNAPSFVDGFGTSISTDGRFVVFDSAATNLVAGDTNGQLDVFVRDRLLGLTELVSVEPDSARPGGLFGRISADGRLVVFVNVGLDAFVRDRLTGTTELVAEPLLVAAVGVGAGIPNLAWVGPGGDTIVNTPDPGDPTAVDALLFPDGDLDDVVLEVVNAADGGVTTLCPAGDVAVADGRAVFLRPETQAGTTTTACPDAGPLNGDGLVDDEVVTLWKGTGPARNLGRAATAVALSSSHVGALVSEAGDGVSYNGDGDLDDDVVQLQKISGAPGAWIDTGQAADSLVLAGSRAVFSTLELAQGAILNGDADQADRVLQVFDAAKPSTPALAVTAVEDFVVGDAADTLCGKVRLVALRTPEAAQNDGVFTGNGDGDDQDDILQVYDLESGTLESTGQAVTPCRLVECDPRLPYRVEGSRVTFLTLESDQGGGDLDGNGIAGADLVLQVFDFCTGAVTPIGAVSTTAPDPLGDGGDALAFTADVGRCDLGTTCDPTVPTSCPGGSFCDDDVCDVVLGACRAHPTLACASDADCQRCLLRHPGTCAPGGDECPGSATCVPTRATVASPARDGDGDGVPDALDVCPETPDPLQEDGDGDRVGDACDAEVVRPVSARALVLRDPANPAKRKLVLVSKDTALPVPAADGGADPTAVGGSITLSNPATLESISLPLPASGWSALGKPPGTKGFRYRDRSRANGPCTAVIYRPGKVFKARCAGAGIAFTLDEPSQGSLGVTIEVGSKRVCVEFGGAVKKDQPLAGRKAGLFKAADAPAPAGCPAV